MIDGNNRTSGYRAFIAGEMLLAASVIVIGLFSQRGPILREFADEINGQAAEGQAQEEPSPAPSQNAYEGSTMAAAASTAAPSTETAAEVEPDENGGDQSSAYGPDENGASQSPAYSKVQEDGQNISDSLKKDTGRMYTEKELILVNPWHLLPEDYEPELESVEYGHQMDACAAEHLRDMLADCRAAGYSPLVCSSFRERSKQERLFENDVRRFMYSGMTEEEARAETARNVAVPGSSEHEAGLAVDIVYSGRQILDEEQENNGTQQWLMHHCHEYGFILRYPHDKQEITGITYEPWHYRYVGAEAAEEIMSRGICLEEYLGVIDAPSADQAPGTEENIEDGESGEENP